VLPQLVDTLGHLAAGDFLLKGLLADRVMACYVRQNLSGVGGGFLDIVDFSFVSVGDWIRAKRNFANNCLQ
jgi:hypothetical protein